MVDGKRRGSLLGLLDCAVTGMGSRRIRRWIGAPLLDPETIERRLDAVELLVRSRELRSALRARLEFVHDIERLNGKVMSGRAHARDLVALRRSLEQAPAIDVLLDREDARDLMMFAPLPDLSGLLADIQATLADDPPTSLSEGGLIRRGHHPELDELIDLSREGKGALARLEVQERRRTGISSLKVRYNRVFGWYIEVTKANLGSVPEEYIRKQTLANAERYYTPELKEFEAKVLGAQERRGTLEMELFQQLRDRVAARARDLAELADRLAAIDAAAAFAELAVRHDYVRPVVDDGDVIELKESRHPVIEQMRLDERFVPNDILLDRTENQLLIVSGPNMAGKSTVMRQAALVVLLAQSGCFVPARDARIGVVDRIFTRVGASDNIARGQSTFMVEMSETAAILHHATERSLCILDEIGRGTSTFDGLAIAWAVAEYIADTLGCRTMFATHYHELSELASTRPQVRNVNIAVSEMGGRIIFLRRLRDGGTSRSYGIQVAKLAGIPEPVLERARQVLANLETDSADEIGRPKLARGRGRSKVPAPGQLTLFADRSSVLKDALLKLDVDQLTPIEALNLLADLRAQAERL
jgi:DNA mismatch repair protein MutS